MANIKSAAKRAQTSEQKRLVNRAVRSNIASARREFFEAIAAGDRTKSAALFKQYASILDKAAKHGVIQGNNASRRKSRAALKLAGLPA